MCYIISKKFNELGCYALKSELGDKLASLSRYLTLATLDKNVQIVTISDPNVYKEYEPYTFVISEKEFINKTLEL
ncbi:DUF6718 family protein [Clostridium perfringens]|uniref:Uncharacterized protein n=2 Tax=Clostridium perfringens TaxID=1502 RepID=A0A8H9R0R6_CLOPF|nr:DUF6718 family protein [Clostridium perfringens]MDU7944368.1 DUF6718 family protein [Streptococcus salivarius]MDU7977666.1 DUF6718 family protein [Clostridioides difficile]EDT15906.1 conserved hypothetical protein [Clostridium perfringens E str. JGS1987]MBI6024504.1 hypothetical protein [Clostridium perfringens]MBI6048509.1 hypothetical protein [Clostridium perfringens]